MTDLEKKKAEVIKTFLKLTEDNSNWYKESLKSTDIFSFTSEEDPVNYTEKIYFDIDTSFKRCCVYVYINSGYQYLFRFGYFGIITNRRMREIVKRLDAHCRLKIVNEHESKQTNTFNRIVEKFKTKADIREEKIEEVLDEIK